MHGVIAFHLERFVRRELGDAAWEDAVAELGLGAVAFTRNQPVEDEDVVGLLALTAEGSGRPLPRFLEDFGRDLAPALLRLYRTLIGPEWRSLELFLHVERTIHDVVRMRFPEARPPELRCQRLGPREVELHYGSARRLCAVMRGLIHGVGDSYGEELEVEERTCMLQGAAACTLRVRHASAPPAPTNAGEALPAAAPATRGGWESTIDVSKAAARPEQVRVELPVPARIGRYEVEAEIGRGGMGAVYRARDPQLDRPVAIKVTLLGERERPDAVARFLREAKAAARLHHPAIVPIHDLGLADGKPFYVMKLVEGTSVREWAEGKPVRHVLGLCREVALALDYAHGVGLVHRDIKPENVMVADDRPYVLDFGLVRDTTVDSDLTEVGQALGTPTYMAPEQFEGIPENVGPRTDVYALGAMAYHLLCGQPPFSSGPLADVVRRVLLVPPPDPRELRADLPEDVATTLLRCLAKRSEERPPSARALADALAACLEG